MSTSIHLRYGRNGASLTAPDHAQILTAPNIPALPNPTESLHQALNYPIASPSLSALLETLHTHNIQDNQITIVIGTGMHRPSTPDEKLELVGKDILNRIHIIDHKADAPDTLLRITDTPPVSVNKLFAHADFRIVTGLIEPHFMAGYSGGRKGICPALVDLHTIQRFHGHQLMGDPNSASGIVNENPCHAESLRIARIIDCDFLLNVAINAKRKITGIFAGDMEQAHAKGVEHVAHATSALVETPADLVITSAGGYPLDQTFYQTVKGIVTALPACHKNSTLLILSDCSEGIGSDSYKNIMFQFANRWRDFLTHIQSAPVQKDQWQAQLHTRALNLLSQSRLLLATDAIPSDTLQKLWVTPVEGTGTAPERTQHFLNTYIAQNPQAQIAIIPEGPYTLLRQSN